MDNPRERHMEHIWSTYVDTYVETTRLTPHVESHGESTGVAHGDTFGEPTHASNGMAAGDSLA